jgi:hypothetical protein
MVTRSRACLFINLVYLCADSMLLLVVQFITILVSLAVSIKLLVCYYIQDLNVGPMPRCTLNIDSASLH